MREGSPGKADEVNELNKNKGGCVKMQTRGEGVKKIGKKIEDVLNGRPPIFIVSGVLCRVGE